MAFAKRIGPLRTVVGAASILIWLELRIGVDALRFVSSRDMKHAAQLKQQASSGALTSYGQPAGARLLYRETAVDHLARYLLASAQSKLRLLSQAVCKV